MYPALRYFCFVLKGVNAVIFDVIQVLHYIIEIVHEYFIALNFISPKNIKRHLACLKYITCIVLLIIFAIKGKINLANFSDNYTVAMKTSSLRLFKEQF